MKGFGFLLGVCLTAAVCVITLAQGNGPASNKIAAGTTELTEFGLSQDQSVETLTCKSFMLQGDFQGYGQLTGANCTATGPIFQTGPASQGHTHVDLSIPAQSLHLIIDGCRVESVFASPGYYHYNINCVAN